MAYTTPRTWVSAELVTATIMNAHVRDNLNWIYGLLLGTSAGQTVQALGANGTGGDYNTPAHALHTSQLTTGWWKNAYASAVRALSYSVNGVEAITIADDRTLVVFGNFEARPGTVTGYPTPTIPGLKFQVQSAGIFGGNSAATVLTLNRTTSDGTILSFQQDGSEEGFVSVSGTTLTYQTFLGAHPTQLLDGQEEPPLYGVVVATGQLCPSENTWYEEDILGKHNNGKVFVKETIRHHVKGKKSWRRVIGNTRDDMPVVGQAAERGDKRVYGVWFGIERENAAGLSFGLNDRPVYSVAAVGLGRVRVTDTNGDIAVGDYIQASERPYEGERQESNLTASTVAKALVDVSWANVPVDPACGYRWCVIPATLHAG